MVIIVMTEDTIRTKAADWLYEAIDHVNGDVLLASPYLSFEVCRLLAQAAKGSKYRWQLFACLDPGAVANGFLRTDGLKELKDSGVDVRHVDRLHAKAFIVGCRGFLGSANLTGAGLGSSAAPNVELGIELDAPQIDSARLTMKAWSSREVTTTDLDEVHELARGLTQAVRSSSSRPDSVSGPASVEQLLLDARDGDRALWMKSEYGDPDLNQWRGEWYFGSPQKGKGKGRPRISPGDLVLICAQTKDCYAVVEVTSAPEYLPRDYAVERGQEADRWPWVSRTKPRFVPDEVVELKASELVRSTRGLQNGHIKLRFEQFTYAVRSLGRLTA